MEWFKDLLSSIRSTSLERINSPVSGAFAFSWFFWNWKPVLLLIFGVNKFEERLNEADTYIGFTHSFLYPILSTALICWTLPRINKLVSTFQKEPNSETMKIAFERKKQTLTWDIELQRLSAQSSVAYEEEKANLEVQIAQSQKVAEDTRKQMVASQQKVAELERVINQKQVEFQALVNSVSQKDQEISDLTETKNSYSLLSSEYEKEKKEHEITKQSLSTANSQNKSMYIELQDLKSKNNN